MKHKIMLRFLFFLLIASFSLSAFTQEVNPGQLNRPSSLHEFSQTPEDPLLLQQKSFSDDLISSRYHFSGEEVIDYLALPNFIAEVLAEQEFERDENILRAPPGGTWQTGGVPLGDGLGIIFILLGIFIVFKILKDFKAFKDLKALKVLNNPQKQNPMKKNLLFILCLLTFTTTLHAQQPLKALNFNAYLTTDATTGATINVLVRNEMGTCDKDEVDIILPENGKTANGADLTVEIRGSVENPRKTVIYTAPSDDPGFNSARQDSFRYKMLCNGVESNEALVIVNAFDRPDNILWSSCAVPTKTIDWGIKETRSTRTDHGTYQIPIVGDIDGDGTVEIVVSSGIGGESVVDGLYRPATSLSIYRGNNLTTPYKTFETTYRYSWGNAQKYAIVRTKIESEEKGIIIVSEEDHHLRAYDINGTNLWVSDQPYYSTATGDAADANVSVGTSLADLNKDGIPEILIAGRIFDSSTGNLLAYNEAESFDPMTAADTFHDGELRCIVANRIYRVITDTDNKVTGLELDKTITPPLITNADTDYTSGTPLQVAEGGRALVVDIDNDGKVDLVVSTRESALTATILYIADPETGTIKASKYIPKAGASSYYPFAGDIDGDGKAELVVIKSISGNAAPSDPNNYMYAFKYDPDNESKVLDTFWSLKHTDGSGYTGITLFDFDQDGKAELIYRDMTQLRIMDGSATSEYDNRNKVVFSNMSGTGYEYPTIADIDGDGQVDILIVGGTAAQTRTGSLRVYKSLDPINSPWAPARTVWNQYYFNPVYVNEDLTMVKNPTNPASVFVDHEGNIHRPFNNVLQQATLFDSQGKMFSEGPDLAFDSSLGSNNTGVTIVSTDDDHEITLHIINEGDADFDAPMMISCYTLVGGVFERIFYDEFELQDDILVPAGTVTLNFTIEDVDLSAGIQIRLNETENTFGQPECVYYNNFYSTEDMYGAPSQILCEGAGGRVNFYPQNSDYTYLWYNADADGTQLGTGDYLTFEKDGSLKQTVYVEVYIGNTRINEGGRYPVDVYLAPEELVWTGASNNQNWHDPANWFDRSIVPVDVTARIPRKCTNVLIPDGLDHYPDLTRGATIYSVYATPQCADIRFEFGGEVARTDMLDYDRAFVQYNFGYYEGTGVGTYTVDPGFTTVKPSSGYEPSHLARDRYYALAAPLKKIVTGDFSFGGYPSVWQMKYTAQDVAGYPFAGFTETYNSLGTLFDEEQLYATALWVPANNTGLWGESRTTPYNYQVGLDGLEGIIEMPFFENETELPFHLHHTYDDGKSTIYYYWQDRESHPVSTSHDPAVIERGDEAYRFIFDEEIEQIDGKNVFKINVPAGREIMIGNPTMSTLDFDAFYAENTGKIENYYRLFKSEVFSTGNQFTTINGTGADPIAPLQAFFIKTIGTGTVDLVYPFETASITRATGTAHALRANAAPKYNVLQIDGEFCRDEACLVSADGRTNLPKEDEARLVSTIYLVLNEEDEKNVNQLFYLYAEKTPQLYLTDSNNQRNAIQFEGKQERDIPLGILSEQEGTITLHFRNTNHLPVESLVLIDTKTGEETNLLEANTYSFINDPSYNDRFLLRVGSQTTGIFLTQAEKENSLQVYAGEGSATVTANQLISAIEVFDTRGQLIGKQSQVNKTSQRIAIQGSGLFILRVTLADGERLTEKVILR